jgi:hypothetical protein
MRIILSFIASLIVLYLLTLIGINNLLLWIVMAIIPTVIYSIWTGYKQKPFLISIAGGFVLSSLLYFILQIIVIVFGLGSSVSAVGVTFSMLFPILIYHRLIGKAKI